MGNIHFIAFKVKSINKELGITSTSLIIQGSRRGSLCVENA
jgi:hypothetical protein